MNEMITFRTAGTIIFGSGSLEQIADITRQLGGKRIVIITDKGLIRSGLVDRLTTHLKQLRFAVFDDVEETPGLETVHRATEFAKREEADLLIGFGGGSPMDAAKAVSVMVTNGGHIKDYLGRNTVRMPGLKKILVPTTSGTGSEVTIFSVLAEREKGKQVLTGIADKHILPEVAVIDPILTSGMPPALSANTGIDAFSHAVESYLNIKSNFQTEPLALASIKLLTTNLERATFHGADLESRSHMSAGSVLAGMSLSQTGGGLAHALAETIQIPYKLPHGAVIGVILPHAMSFNMTANPFKYAEMAKAMGVHADGFSEMDLAKMAIEKVRALIKKVGLPEKLSHLGIPKQDIPMIAHLTTDLSPSLLKVNPRVPSEHDLIEILSNAF